MHTDVLDHQKNYDYLWQTGSSLTARNPNQQLSSELNELASRWNKLLSSVKKRVGEYDVVVEKLTVLEKIRELEKWTDDATEKTADFLIQSNGDIAKAQAKIKVGSLFRIFGCVYVCVRVCVDFMFALICVLCLFVILRCFTLKLFT